ENLGMGAMTMVFKVKDPAMLSQVKAGDTIDFVADEVDGALTVVKLQKP
ncbi:copper-binding protein, partial [Burkholderia pseudomallei]|nr:copper-binding protein [Burkholderia pseudomallei]MBF3604111.1 copper-binding protein [Burkholderia pseudomallei]MBF3911974.1 copper-binding protein [Burkholderia pseudomallei]